MKLIVLQFEPIWEDVAKSLQRLNVLFERHFNKQINMTLAKKQAGQTNPKTSVDCLVVLPELFASGFSMQPQKFSENFPLTIETSSLQSPGAQSNQPGNTQGNSQFDQPVRQHLRALAKQYHVEILAGVAQQNHQGFYNSAMWFDANGELKLHYQKQKLFRYANEHLSYRPGEKASWARLLGDLQTSVFICYDLRFPELFRKVAKQTQMVMVIANWPQSRIMHWQVLLQARAIENQLWVLGVNRLGQDGNGLTYCGHSMLFNPQGELVFDAHQNEWFEYDLDVQLMQQLVLETRAKFPVLEDL